MNVKGKLGARQLEFLTVYKRETAVRFKPTRTGRPDAVMQSLARRGLIWIERRQVAHWRPGSVWDERNEMCWFFGLTAEGLSVANRERWRERGTRNGAAE